MALEATGSLLIAKALALSFEVEIGRVSPHDCGVIELGCVVV